MKITYAHLQPVSYYKYLSGNAHRKFITAVGRKYKEELIRGCREVIGDTPPSSGIVSVCITFTFGNKRKNDLDNFAKPILDCLGGVLYGDDRQIHHLNLIKKYKKNDPSIIISMEEIEEGFGYTEYIMLNSDTKEDESNTLLEKTSS